MVTSHGLMNIQFNFLSKERLQKYLCMLSMILEENRIQPKSELAKIGQFCLVDLPI